MADLTITAASVVPGSNARITNGIAGETITAGKAVHLAASGKWMLSDADSATALTRTVGAVALNGASLNQPIAVQTRGDLTIGATLTPNTPYFLSGTAGGICPLADVGTGEYLTQIGIARTTAILQVQPISTGIAN